MNYLIITTILHLENKIKIKIPGPYKTNNQIKTRSKEEKKNCLLQAEIKDTKKKIKSGLPEGRWTIFRAQDLSGVINLH